MVNEVPFDPSSLHHWHFFSMLSTVMIQMWVNWALKGRNSKTETKEKNCAYVELIFIAWFSPMLSLHSWWIQSTNEQPAVVMTTPSAIFRLLKQQAAHHPRVIRVCQRVVDAAFWVFPQYNVASFLEKRQMAGGQARVHTTAHWDPISHWFQTPYTVQCRKWTFAIRCSRS